VTSRPRTGDRKISTAAGDRACDAAIRELDGAKPGFRLAWLLGISPNRKERKIGAGKSSTWERDSLQGQRRKINDVNGNEVLDRHSGLQALNVSLHGFIP